MKKNTDLPSRSNKKTIFAAISKLNQNFYEENKRTFNPVDPPADDQHGSPGDERRGDKKGDISEQY